MNNIVIAIIAALVLVVVLTSMYIGFKYGIFNWVKNLPIFGRGENAEFNEEELNFHLKNPDIFTFKVSGKLTLFYNCKKNDGWYWETKLDSSDLVRVNESEGYSKYESLGDADKEFIGELDGESCEYGLNLMRVRVLENRDGGWLSGTTRLLVHYSGQVKMFLPGNPEIKNIEDLIIRLNRYSESSF